MTLKEVASKLQTTEATVQRYESTIKNIPYDVIEKYAEIFNVTPSYIMGWEKPIPLKNLFNEDKIDEILNMRSAIQRDESLTQEQKIEKIHELREISAKYAYEHPLSTPDKNIQNNYDNNHVHESSDYLVNELIDRLNHMPPRQRAKVIDAIFTLLDNASQ
jgi:transcriptional regulator with XRE-family HTH domain